MLSFKFEITKKIDDVVIEYRIDIPEVLGENNLPKSITVKIKPKLLTNDTDNKFFNFVPCGSIT